MTGKILKSFAADIARCYKGKNILWQLLAVALTYIIVVTDFDWYYFTHTREVWLQNILFPAAIVGGIVPILLPIILFIVGKVRKNIRTIYTAYAVTEAGLFGLFISSFYKIFTGRVQPPLHSQNLVDISRQFEFGFLRHGAFWGWPSTHTTVAFAVAVALYMLYRSNRYIKYGALLVALYIGIGVSTNIHWFSEFVAGAIIGSVIGAVVGKSFRYILDL
ncbi:MAG: phosphatase PAP2 family protein [Minisyncoccia bacterium]|jgi:membrane-associated phospholipid phosphatase